MTDAAPTAPPTPPAAPPQDATGLTRFIETTFHARHRAQLPELAALSQKVEQVHAGQDQVPAGLSDLLRHLIGDMEVHMKKEELILFPAMRKAATAALAAPVAVMRKDHDDHMNEISQIRYLTHDMTPPPDACRSWTRLYDGLRGFVADLQEHIRLENEVLFPQFEESEARDV